MSDSKDVKSSPVASADGHPIQPAQNLIDLKIAAPTKTQNCVQLLKLAQKLVNHVNKLPGNHPKMEEWFKRLRPLQLDIFRSGRAETIVRKWIVPNSPGINKTAVPILDFHCLFSIQVWTNRSSYTANFRENTNQVTAKKSLSLVQYTSKSTRSFIATVRPLRTSRAVP
jgi:hypothetical protein